MSYKSDGLMIAGVVAFSIVASRGCDMFCNNRQIDTAGRHTISYATGLVGHNEYTRYTDGSSDMKIYPSIVGHRVASSKMFQDLDGDGLVDRIRINGPEWQMNRLVAVWCRDADYQAHKKEFDEADSLMAKEGAK